MFDTNFAKADEQTYGDKKRLHIGSTSFAVNFAEHFAAGQKKRGCKSLQPLDCQSGPRGA